MNSGCKCACTGESTGAGTELGDNARNTMPKQGAGAKCELNFTSTPTRSAEAVIASLKERSNPTERALSKSDCAEVPWQAQALPSCRKSDSAPTLPRPISVLDEQDTLHFADIPGFKKDDHRGLKQRKTTTSSQHEHEHGPATEPHRITATGPLRTTTSLTQPLVQHWVPRNNGLTSLPMCAARSSGSFESSTHSLGSAGGVSGTLAGAGWVAAGISAASSGWSQQSTHLSVATTTVSPNWGEKVVIYDRFPWSGVRSDQPGLQAPQERDSAAAKEYREPGKGRGSCWRDVREQARVQRDRDAVPRDTGAVSLKRHGHACSHTNSWTSVALSQTSFTSRKSLNSDSLIERINFDLMELEAFESLEDASGSVLFCL